MSWLNALIQGLWIILPAYVANGAGPVFGGERRMDFGKKLGGNDLLGAGKTWEGFLFAVAAGTFVGFLQVNAWSRVNGIVEPLGFSLPIVTVSMAFLIAFTAMFGDVVASFFKRRVGVERGRSFPLLDQLDFLVFSLPVALVFTDVTYAVVAIIVFITPPIHFLFNLLAYYIGIKEVPW